MTNLSPTRRSLALRRPDTSSALRPMVPGFINFTGIVGEYLRLTRPIITTVTSLEFMVRVSPSAIGIGNRMCGWDNLGARLNIQSDNKLVVSILGTGIVTIGGAASSVAASVVVGQPIWLRGKVTVATAVCEYWTSTTTTDNYEQVVWTSLGTPQTGTNAGVAVNINSSDDVNVGVDSITNPSYNGKIHDFVEFVSGVRTAWFNDADIPAPTVTEFTSAAGGQRYVLSPGTPPTVFHQSESYQGALRSDFFFNESTTGLTEEDAMGVIGVDHETTRISYKPGMIPEHPTLGTFEEAMVVRSTAGFPATNLDGAMLMRHVANDPLLAGGWASVLDTDLIGQQWYYYALFVRYDATSGWFKTDEEAWLNPGQYGYPTRIWNNFPNYYRRIDQGIWLDPGYLRRICNTVGYEFDLLRSWAATVGDVWDFEKLSAKLLPEAGAALGLAQESANGDRRLRTLVGNIMALRKKKGTKDGVEGYVAAQTGWPSRAYEGLNLLHRTQHAEWPYAFTATNNSASAGTENNPGWSSRVGGTNYGILSRQTMAAGEGAGIGMADGLFYLRNTNDTGAASLMTIIYGSDNSLNGLNGVHSYIPVIAGHSYKFTSGIKASAVVTSTLQVDWFDQYGVAITPTVVSTSILGTLWARQGFISFTAPATAAYARPRLYIAGTMGANSHLNIVRPMLADLSWRPEGIPTLQSLVPLSSSNAGDVGTFVHQNYYEPPREVKVNVYPMRTNLALNSDFLLNNLPPEAWASFDAPTYGQLPIAYSNYADIIDAEPGDSEANYLDMATGLAPLTGSLPVRTFDTANGRMVLTKSTSPFAFSIMHTYFPATDLGGMSAAVSAFSNVANTKMSITFEWYTAANSANRINIAGVPVRTTSPEYTLTTTTRRYEVINAQPPVDALYGRLFISCSNTTSFNVSFDWALIEDSPFPESYFNGDYPDGDDGDFFYAVGRGYTGAAHLSPSVYYQQFRHFASGVAGSDTLSQLMPFLLPFRRSFKVLTAATGLYNEIT